MMSKPTKYKRGDGGYFYNVLTYFLIDKTSVVRGMARGETKVTKLINNVSSKI